MNTFMQKKLPRVFLFIDEFNINDLSKLNKNIDIIYRNYRKKIDKSTLLSIKKLCKNSKRKFYLSNNIKFAIDLKLDGIYIPAFNKVVNYQKYNVVKNFNIIGSAHNKKEIFIKKKQGCDLIFLSPLFENQKSRKKLNVIRFNLITLNEKKKFIALGGINEKNFKQVYLTKSIGLAGISWVKKNGPRLNLRPF